MRPDWPRRACGDPRANSAEERVDSASLVSGPKLMRRKPAATSSGTAIAASTWLALALPDEQALPADTAIPARSSWTSSAAPSRAGQRQRADRRRRAAHCSAMTVAAGRLRRPVSSRSRSAAMPRHVIRPGGQRRGEGQRARARPGCRADSPSPARRRRLERGQIADQQRANPRRPAQLVRANGDEIGVGQRHLRRALRAIGQQQRPGVADVAAQAGRVGWIDPGLVIDLLDRDQRRALGQHRVERRLVDQPVGVDRNDRRPLAHRERHDRMFGRAIAPAPARAPACPPISTDFARARGEDDVMTPAQRLLQRLARLLQQGARGAALGVRASWGCSTPPSAARKRLARRARSPAWSRHDRDRCGWS